MKRVRREILPNGVELIHYPDPLEHDWLFWTIGFAAVGVLFWVAYR